MQVGIADATFGSSTPLTYYTDFELSGANVAAAPTLPANPTGLTASPSGQQEMFSWTPGAGSAGSILVIRKNNPLALSGKPINGFTYTPNATFAAGDDLGSSIYVAYAGSGNSVVRGRLGNQQSNLLCGCLFFCRIWLLDRLWSKSGHSHQRRPDQLCGLEYRFDARQRCSGGRCCGAPVDGVR